MGQAHADESKPFPPMKNKPKTDPLNPTDAQRVAAYAARYDIDPTACRADGATVFDGEGFGCWTLTIAEVNAIANAGHDDQDVATAHRWHDQDDRFTHGGTTWVIFPL